MCAARRLANPTQPTNQPSRTAHRSTNRTPASPPASFFLGLGALCYALRARSPAQGWWTYEFCHRKSVRQYHQADGAVARFPPGPLPAVFHSPFCSGSLSAVCRPFAGQSVGLSLPRSGHLPALIFRSPPGPYIPVTVRHFYSGGLPALVFRSTSGPFLPVNSAAGPFRQPPSSLLALPSASRAHHARLNARFRGPP